MRTLIGWLFILAAIGLAIFVGGYLMIYGGIVQIVDGISADPEPDSSDIALGVVRVVFFETAAFLAALIPFCLGAALLDDESGRRRPHSFIR